MPLPQTNPVREVAAKDFAADLVDVNYAAIRALQAPANIGAMGPALCGTPLDGDVHAFVPYFIVMNTMNYQFWDIDADGAMTRYGKDGLVGALAMQSSFQKAWCELAGSVQDSLSRTQLESRVLQPLRERIESEGVEFLFGDIPAAPGRAELLLEVLDQRKLASVSTYLIDRTMSQHELAWYDAQLLAGHFPRAYGDRYLKKAQLTLMFIAAQWNASCARASWSRCTLDVTACADYQLPKVLRALGVLEYAPAIAGIVDSEIPVHADTPLERAIRAATVIACDALAEHFGTSIAAVDFWLWEMRNKAREAKFHLTCTTAY